MAISPAQRKAVAKYNAANYDRVELRLPKGRKAEVEAHARNIGETINGYINALICTDMEISTEEWGKESNMKTLSQLRRALDAHGYKLVKKQKGEDSWMIVDYRTNGVVAGGGESVNGLTTEEVQEWVNSQE